MNFDLLFVIYYRYSVATMYIDCCTYTVKGKTYSRHLLRESYRDNGKVRHRTLANLSRCSQEEIRAMKLALKHKHNLQELGNINQDMIVQQGISMGAVWLLWQVAQRLGLVKALGSSQNGKRALWQVLARVIDQGSRLSAVRLASHHAASDVLTLDAFDDPHFPFDFPHFGTRFAPDLLKTGFRMINMPR